MLPSALFPSLLLLLFSLSVTAAPPNIILLMSDDQGWGDVGFNGHPAIKTPHLDEMAANGAVFERFYSVSSICSPTRASCLTGRYPYRSGIIAAHTAGMRVGEITLAEALAKKGYATGFFGKWHLGWLKPDEIGTRGHYSPPWHHGYEETFATTSAVPTYNPTKTPDNWTGWGSEPGEPWKGGDPYVHNGVATTENMQGDDSRVIMDRVLPFLTTNKDKPFLATIWFHAPHEPVYAGPEHRKPYAKFSEEHQHYYGCITAMDEQIGRLRKFLQQENLAENTLLFFCSDNGPSTGVLKRGIASAGQFRGSKHTVYEGGHLVPACVEWPGKIPAGTKVTTPCATIDYFPTITKIVGYEFSKGKKRPLDGIDLMPIIKGEQQSRKKDLFFGYRRLYQNKDGAALISGNYKVLREAVEKKPRTRLYNLSKDPYEKNDLAKKEPEKLTKMLEKLKAIDEDCARSRDGADYAY